MNIENNNVNNGLMTKIWGPAMWVALHSIAFGYPINPSEEKKEKYKLIFENLGFVLPCGYCCESYGEFLKSDDTILDDSVFETRESLTRWIYKLHNRVNKKLNNNYDISYEEYCNKYESYRAQCVPKDDKCNMPLELKAIAFKNNDNKTYQIIDIKIALGFVHHAKLLGFNNYEETIYKYKDIVSVHNIEFDERNKKCGEIIKKMRYEALPALDDNKMPTLEELQLMSMLSSSLSETDLLELLPNKKKYFLRL